MTKAGGLNDRIAEANNAARHMTYPLICEGQRIGRLTEEHYMLCLSQAGLFEQQDNGLWIDRRLNTRAAREAAFEVFLGWLTDRGWLAREHVRGELFPAVQRFGDEPLFCAERALFTFLGLRSFGVHVNGWTVKNGERHLWVAKRAASKNVAPGKLDQIVGGGQPADMSLQENLIKECAEEAGIPEALARAAVPASVVPVSYVSALGYSELHLHMYDLELPPDFTPVNRDGEVERFELWPVDQVIEHLENTTDFTVDVALCIIDWLQRYGYVSENDVPPVRLSHS